MRRGGNPDDTYSRATLSACSNVLLALFILIFLLSPIVESMRLSHILSTHAMSLLTSVLVPPCPLSGGFVLTLNLIYFIFSSVMLFHLFYMLYRNEYGELPAITFRGCDE